MGARHSMEQYLDRPSSDTGLRRRELKALSRCWVVIERDLRDQSIKLFVRLMRKHPEYRRYFGTLANSPPVLTQIAADARVQSHFRTILTSVGSLVYNAVNNPDNLVPKYDFLALVHRHLGLTLQDFFNFRDELIDYFKSEFPSQMTPLCVGAWHTLLTRAFTEIFRRIDEFHRTSRRHHHHHHHHKHKRRSTQERVEATGSFVGSKSMASIFESTGETLYWEHRKPFWKTQLELWGEAEDDDWLDDEEDDDDLEAEDVLSEPDPHETRRQRARRRWRRLLKRLRRYLRRRRST